MTSKYESSGGPYFANQGPFCESVTPPHPPSPVGASTFYLISLFDRNLLNSAVAAPFQTTARAIAHGDAHTSREAGTTCPYKDGSLLPCLL